MPPPRVTCIIPTRNRPQLMLRALEAVLTQDYGGHVDCIVVNDGGARPPMPPDEPRVRLIDNSRTSGLPGARNSGILEAEADLLAFCDDDDEWLTDKLTRQVQLIEATNGGVVCSGCEVTYRGHARVRTAPATVSFHTLLRHRVPELHSSNLLVRREALSEVGLFDESLPHSEDYDWLLRAARRSPIVSVPDPLVRIHWRDDSWFAEGWHAKVQAIDLLLEKHPEFQTDHAAYARLLALRSFASVGAGMRSAAWRDLRAAVGSRWGERWNLLAALACSGIPPGLIRRVLHRFGRGV